MASHAQAYRETPASASEKLSPFQLRQLVEYSGVPQPLRHLILAAFKISQDAGLVIWSSVGSLSDETKMSPRTIYHRRRRLLKLNLWKPIRDPYTWDDCPKCGEKREINTCAKCGYRCDHAGHKKKLPNGEWSVRCPQFRRPPTFLLNVERIDAWPRPKGVRGGSYREHKKSRDTNRIESGHRSTAHASPSNEERKQEVPAAKPALVVPSPVRDNLPVVDSTHAIPTQISSRLATAARRLMEFCGLPHLSGNERYVEAAILAEAKFRGVEIEDGAKHLADCVLRDQRNGITVGRFYFRDAKWRSHGGQQSRPSASSQRSERSKANLLEALRQHREQRDGGSSARGPDAPDGPERKE